MEGEEYDGIRFQHLYLGTTVGPLDAGNRALTLAASRGAVRRLCLAMRACLYIAD